MGIKLESSCQYLPQWSSPLGKGNLEVKAYDISRHGQTLRRSWKRPTGVAHPHQGSGQWTDFPQKESHMYLITEPTYLWTPATFQALSIRTRTLPGRRKTFPPLLLFSLFHSCSTLDAGWVHKEERRV